MVTIALESLGVSLGRRMVLQGVSATLTPGTLIGIIGPNGAGKSTLARAMLALLPPASGRVTIDGEDAARIGRATLARKIAYLPQGQTLHWPLTVERLVGLGRLPHLAPMSRIANADQVVIEAAMVRADVVALRDCVATELSGGERARVLLARALAVEAPALIADEPLASLDPGHQIQVMELLKAQAQEGALVVTILHDLTMAARYCDRLLLFNGGALLADGHPADVLNAQALAAVYGIRARIDMAEGAPLIVPLQRSD
jgi:iron complex transport system ATP-binding protein